jgi:hypothetical protein
MKPFKKVLDGSLALRVKDAFIEDKPEGVFDAFIVELRHLLVLHG